MEVLDLPTSGSILVTAVSTGKLPLAFKSFDFPNTIFIDHDDKHVIEQPGGYNMLAMDLLGPSLDAVFQKCGRHFSPSSLTKEKSWV